MESNRERRKLMRRIWSLTVNSDEGRWRLERFGQPWLLENFVEPTVAHLGQEVRIRFPEKRTVDQLPLWERVQRFRQSIPYLVREAYRAREKALSYRDFRVGTALLAFKNHQNQDEAWRVFTGMNTKHGRNMRPMCSEPIAISAAHAEDFTRVIGLAVVGELREEDVGHILTLHPCKDCRWFMHGHPLIDRHTLVLTTPPDYARYHRYADRLDSPHTFKGMSSYEIRSVGQLLRLHRDISMDDFD